MLSLFLPKVPTRSTQSFIPSFSSNPPPARNSAAAKTPQRRKQADCMHLYRLSLARGYVFLAPTGIW